VKGLSDCRQKRPKELGKHEDETMEAWRDRLHVEFNIPVRLVALHDLKLPYVEVINPLFSRRIIKQVQRLPHDLRTDKRLYARIIKAAGPDIPLAKRRATAKTEEILRTGKVVSAISEQLDTGSAREILSQGLIDHVLAGIRKPRTGITGSHGAGRRIRKIANRLTERLYCYGVRRLMDPNTLAFRVYIVCKMTRLLAADADALKESLSPLENDKCRGNPHDEKGNNARSCYGGKTVLRGEKSPTSECL